MQLIVHLSTAGVLVNFRKNSKAFSLGSVNIGQDLVVVFFLCQTWNLSIQIQKILHHQFHLILTVLVGKTQKLRENEEIYTAGKSFTLDRMFIIAKSLSKFIFFW